MSWQLTLSGFLVGGLVGLTGMGGGSLMTPMLVIVFGFNPTTAIGTDILHGAIFKSVRRCPPPAAGNSARAAERLDVPGSRADVARRRLDRDLARARLRRQRGVGRWRGCSESRCCSAALACSPRASSTLHPARRRAVPADPPRPLVALAIGFFCGFIVGLTSVGTGIFFGLTMLLVFPLRAAKIVGTDIFHAAALLWVAGFGHFIAGNVDLRRDRLAADSARSPGCCSRASSRYACRSGRCGRARRRC